MVPRTLKTSTEWCATSARPDSVTMSGCGTPAALQASAIWLTMSARVLLERVVHRGVEVGLAAVVVDAEAAAAIEEAHVGAERVQLDEDAARLAQRVLDRADVRDLRPDVEVEELQAVEHPLVRRRSTVATISAVVRPNFDRSPVDSTHLPAPLVVEPRAHADDRPHLEVARRSEDGLELAHPVHDDDDLAPELLREQRGLDVGAVFVAVAEDERLGVVLQRERHQQLGLGAGLDAEIEGPAVLDQLLDDVALLVDLDRVDAAVVALVVVLGDRLLERAAELLDAACAGCRRSGSGAGG